MAAPLSPELRASCRRLRTQGLSITAVSRVLHLTRTTVYKYTGLARPPLSTADRARILRYLQLGYPVRPLARRFSISPYMVRKLRDSDGVYRPEEVQHVQ